MSYALREDFVAYTGTDAPDQVERLLERASDLMDDVVVIPYLDSDGNFIDEDTNGDSDYRDSLKDAVCAQVEFWLEVGEEHDITNQRGQITVSGLQISKLPDTLADRAKRALGRSGLLNRSIGSGPQSRFGFFADNN